MKKWILVFSLTSLLSAAELQQKTLLELDEVPETANQFLQLPASMDTDSNGNFFVLDWIAMGVFKWNADGTFQKVIGHAGGGPGEFSFLTNGGPQGYLAVVGDTLCVYDGGKRSVLIFDLDGNYKKSVSLKHAPGRAERFFALPDGRFLLHYTAFLADTPTIDLAVFDQNGELLKNLRSIPNDTWSREGDGGRVTGIVLHGFSANLTTSYNASKSEILVGNSGEPAFEVIDPVTNDSRKIRVALSQREVTKEDMAEYKEQPWIKGNTFFKASFPEKMPFYDRVLSQSDGNYLVFLESPHYHRVQGILVDREGKTLGRFNVECGEGGTILGAKGRILLIKTGEDGGFNLHEVIFTPVS